MSQKYPHYDCAVTQSWSAGQQKEEQEAARGRNLQPLLGKVEQVPGGAAHLLTSQQQSSLQAMWQQEHQHGERCDCPSSSSQALLMHRLSYTDWGAAPGLSFPEKSHLSPLHCQSAFLDSFLFNPGLVPASWVASPQQNVPYDVGAVGSRPPGILGFTSPASWGCFLTHAVKKHLFPYSQMDYRKRRCLASLTNLKKGEISETTHCLAVLLAWIFVQCVNSHLELLNFSISLSCTGKRCDYTSLHWGAYISSRHHLSA